MIESIINICLQAGRKVMQVYDGEKVFHCNKKKDDTPVTSADLFANDIIIARLENLTPEIPILSEENCSLWVYHKEVDSFWVVDPLDGTKEFLSHNYEFTVNIALIEHGRPVMGVIYAPAFGILYAAVNGQAWKMNVNTQYCVKISAHHSYPPVIVISRFHNDLRQLQNYLMKFMHYRIITVGSSLKFCLLAEGVVQVYPRFSFMHIWDIAAGHAIAEAAGAIINDWSGAPLVYYGKVCSSFMYSGFCASVV
ncbi:3'(2'),5'-bisphosphate nucleotidase CysQ [Blochmannia endosymbiont of Polyrhachis (Hedomyrma) turneri]|uniref:3'(2'),5'-bisphosphate nucleotidase CysQ n=1 Tax=Blochmannia endosymbiont of Polyrhachis (Hedomyrma) turneri TaxID=1505596 RepID=UPI00061A57F9|nr:3'(2'),5'-bisphosphate nucleotidase CysQ [Blochmannia endosymbiont of Polyrhachis (Hedomyrma) turneri]AKC59674.1 3'(2'),5'-bisphosphate nucleotidase CysQ [Blochmannia endosymbiont of Polyrhachis (Hedomyrma) turneri]